MRRNVKLVAIDFELLTDMLTTGWGAAETYCVQGLPSGAILERTFTDVVRGCCVMVFSHPDFAEVKEGTEVPYLVIEFERR